MPYVAGIAGSVELQRLAAARIARRLRKLEPLIAAEAGPEHAALVRSARRALTGTAEGGQILRAAAIQGFTDSLEQARDLRLATTAALATPPSSPARRRMKAQLFAQLSATPHLFEVAPRQIPDDGFLERAAKLSERLLRLALAGLPAAFAAHARDGVPGARFPFVAPEDTDLALARGELELSGTPWLLIANRPAGLALGIESGTLSVRRGQRRVFEQPLDRLTPGRGNGIRLAARPRVSGSPSLLVSRRLISLPRSLRVGAPVPGVELRVGQALALLGRVWLEAWREVHLFTALVVPLEEPGTVSYSVPTRPGVSYINVWGKSLLQLTDDLLHETSHHKLHTVEALEPLVDDDGEALWWSPWREAWRPLRGIVHACFTFTYGALLFAHLIASGDPVLTAPRLRFARQRLLEEHASLAFSLADLARANRRRKLTPCGRELLAEMSEIHRRVLTRAARAAERELRGTPQLARIGRLRDELAARRRDQPGRIEAAD